MTFIPPGTSLASLHPPTGCGRPRSKPRDSGPASRPSDRDGQVRVGCAADSGRRARALSRRAQASSAQSAPTSWAPRPQVRPRAGAGGTHSRRVCERAALWATSRGNSTRGRPNVPRWSTMLAVDGACRSRPLASGLVRLTDETSWATALYRETSSRTGASRGPLSNPMTKRTSSASANRSSVATLVRC